MVLSRYVVNSSNAWYVKSYLTGGKTILRIGFNFFSRCIYLKRKVIKNSDAQRERETLALVHSPNDHSS